MFRLTSLLCNRDIAVSIIRVVTVVRTDFADLGYSVVPAFLSALAEPAIAIMVACAICTRPLLEKIIPKSWVQSVRSRAGDPRWTPKSYGLIEGSNIRNDDSTNSETHSAFAYAKPLHSDSIELAQLPGHSQHQVAGPAGIGVLTEIVVSRDNARA